MPSTVHSGDETDEQIADALLETFPPRLELGFELVDDAELVRDTLVKRIASLR